MIDGVTIANFLTWSFLGFIIGLLAYLFDPAEKRGGFFGSILVGGSGAILGGLLVNLSQGRTINQFTITSLFIAITAACAITLAQRILFKSPTSRKIKNSSQIDV